MGCNGSALNIQWDVKTKDLHTLKVRSRPQQNCIWPWNNTKRAPFSQHFRVSSEFEVTCGHPFGVRLLAGHSRRSSRYSLLLVHDLVLEGDDGSYTTCATRHANPSWGMMTHRWQLSWLWPKPSKTFTARCSWQQWKQESEACKTYQIMAWQSQAHPNPAKQHVCLRRLRRLPWILHSMTTDVLSKSGWFSPVKSPFSLVKQPHQNRVGFFKIERSIYRNHYLHFTLGFYQWNFTLKKNHLGTSPSNFTQLPTCRDTGTVSVPPGDFRLGSRGPTRPRSWVRTPLRSTTMDHDQLLVAEPKPH